MAITPTQILRISEPVERMYNDCTSQLLINLCAHFASGKEMELAEWEMKKMSELGTLTQESVAIIARNTGQSPEAIYKAISGALDIELGDVEKTLSRAAQKGTVQSPGVSWQASENVKTVVQNLSEQAVDDMNIVNTTMLRSTQQRYTAAVQYAVSEETAIIERLQGMTSGAALAGQLEKSQRALNQAAMSVATGAETRTEALRRTIDWLGKQGITGYVDSAGRQWTPEAYVNMDIRTTVHNAAVQGQKARSEDYGVRTFQISSHGGARPLCAPYQGKFYSWDAGDSGTVYDIDGNGYHYESIYSTSYGQAAGIFGINCGHSPQTFVNGYSIPRYEPTRDPEENAREYQLMQQQRYMERRVRSSETQALCYKAAGDKEAFGSAAVRVNNQRTQYQEFCKENGLTPRMDRTWVSGYNKSGANAAARKAVSRGIDLDDLAQATYGTGVKDEVRDTIGSTMQRLEKSGGFHISSVSKQMSNTGNGTSVFEIEPVSYGRGPSMLQMNMNTDWLAGKSVDEINAAFASSRGTYANSLEEALIHESGHAKLIHGLSVGEIQSLYDDLLSQGVEGLSLEAEKDGAEAMADIEISLHRGTKLTEEQQALYDQYKR